jgi:hypothetical protein
MAKIGRNGPCPCGSGRKYKKCCGGPQQLASKAAAHNSGSSSSKHNDSMKLQPIGLPGMLQHLTTRYHYREPNDPRNFLGPEGRPGKYQVIFTLSRPGFPLLPEYRSSFGNALKGDSHLAITKPAYSNPNLPDATNIEIYVKNHGTSITFIGYPNERGFLGKFELASFDANNFNDASLKAYRLLMPALSSISLYLDTPLNIYQIDITELETKSYRMSMLDPFQEIPFVGSLPETMTDEFRRYASYYREALNSNSVHYQFICYFKIIEGIRARQKRLIIEAKALGKSVRSRPRHIIPETKEEQVKWLKGLYPIRKQWGEEALAAIFRQDIMGRKVNDIIDKQLTQIRHKIAHAILDSGEPTLSIDEEADIDMVYRWLPLTKQIARLLLKNEFPDAFISLSQS